MLLTKQLLQKVLKNQILSLRTRHFHENPELSGNEYQTKNTYYRLQEIGISDIKTFKNLGIVANIHGAKAEK